jgi:hypothetical protein
VKFVINLEQDDLVDDLKVALDQLTELGFDLDSITINSFKFNTGGIIRPNTTVTSIRNG